MAPIARHATATAGDLHERAGVLRGVAVLVHRRRRRRVSTRRVACRSPSSVSRVGRLDEMKWTVWPRAGTEPIKGMVMEPPAFALHVYQLASHHGKRVQCGGGANLAHRHTRRSYLLRSMVVCAHCDRRMRGRTIKQRRHTYYTCRPAEAHGPR